MAREAQVLCRRTVESASPRETEALAERIGKAARPGLVVALQGELGSGKTLFVRGLARGLGAVDPVASPTFTLMHEYRGGRLPLFHFDAWMEGREAAFLEGGGGEWLDAGGVAAVEWAGRVEAFLPLPRLEIELWHRGAEVRRIELRALGREPAAWLEDLVAGLGRRPEGGRRDADGGSA